MRKILLFISFLFSITTISFSQEMKVKGQVFDTSGVQTLENALVMAVRLRDSVLLDFTRTNVDGNFELSGFRVDTFSLIVDYPRFEPRNYFIIGSATNNEIEINKVILSTKTKELEEVVIYANKNPIYYNGDTLVYVADSFKVAENAVVEDLLKKLPGISVDKDGKITSQGQNISKVLVDGDEFFGNDPTIATKNLGAKSISSVQVYEKKEENSQDGSEETIQVLDLKLKADSKSGYFGKATLASDFQNYHEGEFLYNQFKGSQRFSVYALGSSTPRTGIGFADQNKFGVGSFNNNNSTGVPTTFTSGFSFVDKFGKKKQAKLSLDYSFNNYELRAATSSLSQYILPTDTSYFSDDSTFSKSFQNSHDFNVLFEYQIDSLTSLEINPSITSTNSSNNNLNTSSFLTEDNVLSRNTSILNEIKTFDYSLSNSVILKRKFMKPRREIELSHYFTNSNTTKDSRLNSNNVFVSTLYPDLVVDQLRDELNTTSFQRSKVVYTEPLSKKIKMELEYNYSIDKSSQDVTTNDYANGSYSLFNSTLSNSFRNDRNENKAGIHFVYESRKQVFTVGSFARNVVIGNVNITTNNTINQNVSNLLPDFKYTYKFTQTSRLRMNYRTFSTLPSAVDLQLVQNNTNTNRIVLGNPDLQPNYNHSINLFYNNWNALTGRYIWSNLNGTITNNDFGNSITYDAFGRSVSQKVNVNGNRDISFRVGGGVPLYKRIISVSPQFNVAQAMSSNYINSEINTTTNNSLTATLELKFQKDSLEFSLGAEHSYFKPTNSIPSIQALPYSFYNYSADFTWKTKFKFKIQSDVKYTINNQRAAGYNLSFFVWNMSISRNFLETENLVLSLVGNDILNQNIAAARTVNANIITDNRTKIISRYFLVRLVYKFNNNKIHEEDAKMGWY